MTNPVVLHIAMEMGGMEPKAGQDSLRSHQPQGGTASMGKAIVHDHAKVCKSGGLKWRKRVCGMQN